MKCDELKAYGMNDTAIGDEYEMYKVSDVDAAIAELKAMVTTDNSAVIARLEEQLRKTQRALWLARADRADDRARIFYFNDLETKLDIDGFSFDRKKKKGCKKLTARHWRIIWLKVVRKCLAKAKEYK